MFRILHLSDIHFGRTYKDPTILACKIASAVCHKLKGSPINCIVVTGDVFDGRRLNDEKSNAKLVDIAVSFFQRLRYEINEIQGEISLDDQDVIIVPGNHDIIRESGKNTFSLFHAFLDKYQGDNNKGLPEFYVGAKGCSACPADWEPLFLKLYDRPHKVAIIGFNSAQFTQRPLEQDILKNIESQLTEEKCRAEKVDRVSVIQLLRSANLHRDDTHGFITTSQFNRIDNILNTWHKELSDYTPVVLFHHHFFLFPELTDQVGMDNIISNHSDVLQELMLRKIDIVLHGHKHFALERPLMLNNYLPDSKDNPEGPSKRETFSSVEVFSAGSVGARDISEHTFGVLDLFEETDEKKLIYHKFTYRNEHLEPITKTTVLRKGPSERLVEYE